MILIALTGAARSGKDSCADRLVERHGFTKISFAAPLKRILLAQDPWIGQHPYRKGELVRLSEALANESEDAVKRNFPEYRRLMENLGTEGIRGEDENFFVDKAFDLIDNWVDGRYVFSDARLPNEVYSVKKSPSFTGTQREAWHIVRPSLVGPVGEQHASAALHGNLGEDREVLNDGSLDDLHSVVDAIVEELEDA